MKLKYPGLLLGLMALLVSCHNGYVVEQDAVYYHPLVGVKKVVGSADPKSFAQLPEIWYGRDANHVFFRENVLEGCDPKTVEVLSRHFLKDSRKAYFCSTENEQLLGEYEQHLIECKNSAAFKPMSDYYATDGHAVYFKYLRTKADPQTVRYLGEGYWIADKDVAYFKEVPVPRSDGPSFEFILNSTNQIFDGYCRDKKHIYFFASILSKADYESFEAVEGGFAKDRKRVYYHLSDLNKLEADQVRISGQYAYDDERAYFQNIEIRDVDIATFRVVDDYHAEDSRGNFAREKRSTEGTVNDSL